MVVSTLRRSERDSRVRGRRVTRAARVSAVAAFFLLLMAGLLRAGDSDRLTASSFGAVPHGHGALYDLLTELGLPVGRRYEAVDRLEPGGTVWWIAPREQELEEEAPSLAGRGFARWLEAGGRGVVWLGAEGNVPIVADLPVPARRIPEPRDEEETPEPEPARLAGSLTPRARDLVLSAPRTFEEDAPEGWSVVAWLDASPFVLERPVGDGRLVLVADAAVVTNRWLDQGDAAPFAIDVVRAYGVPDLDEHEHGFVGAQHPIRYLVGSPARSFLLGLALLAVAIAIHGASVPPRRVGEYDPNAPTLETYVASLARLYAATRDSARVLTRYRELTAGRLRRHLGLPPDAPLDSLCRRLASDRRVGADALALLASGAAPRRPSELRRAVATLDGLARELGA